MKNAIAVITATAVLILSGLAQEHQPKPVGEAAQVAMQARKQFAENVRKATRNNFKVPKGFNISAEGSDATLYTVTGFVLSDCAAGLKTAGLVEKLLRGGFTRLDCVQGNVRWLFDLAAYQAASGPSSTTSVVSSAPTPDVSDLPSYDAQATHTPSSAQQLLDDAKKMSKDSNDISKQGFADLRANSAAVDAACDSGSAEACTNALTKMAEDAQANAAAQAQALQDNVQKYLDDSNAAIDEEESESDYDPN